MRGVVCGETKNRSFDYPECPYNTNKPILHKDGTIENRKPI